MKPFHQMPYDFITEQFEYNKNYYRVVLTAELVPEDDGLDFSGRYLGILIDEHRGTKTFELEPDASYKWVSEPRGMDPGFVDILNDIIIANRNQPIINDQNIK